MIFFCFYLILNICLDYTVIRFCSIARVWLRNSNRAYRCLKWNKDNLSRLNGRIWSKCIICSVRYQLFCTADLSPLFYRSRNICSRSFPLFSDQPPNHPSPPTLHSPLGEAAPIFSDLPPNQPSPPTLHSPPGARNSTASTFNPSWTKVI